MKKIIVTGNVGQNPELIKTDNYEFVKFSLAVNCGTKDNPKTDWLSVTCNNKLMDIILKYVTKGTKLLIEGSPTANAYINDKKEAIGTISVNLYTMEILSSKNDSNHPANSEVPF